MRPPYQELFNPDNTEEEIYEARKDICREIGEATEKHPDDRTLFLDVWRNIEAATQAAWKEGDDELHDWMKNNYEIMALNATKRESTA